MLRRSDQNLAQNRLGLDEVPDQISRIFFGKGVSGSRPSYSSAYQPPADSYGVPQGYAASGYNSYPQAGYSYYYGYEDDIYLLAKLGQAALIIFIILAVVIIIFLLTTCCMAVFKKKESKQQLPPSYVPQPVILQSKADTKTGGEKGLTRSGGMTNLNMDSDSSPTMGGR